MKCLTVGDLCRVYSPLLTRFGRGEFRLRVYSPLFARMIFKVEEREEFRNMNGFHGDDKWNYSIKGHV